MHFFQPTTNLNEHVGEAVTIDFKLGRLPSGSFGLSEFLVQEMLRAPSIWYSRKTIDLPKPLPEVVSFRVLQSVDIAVGATRSIMATQQPFCTLGPHQLFGLLHTQEAIQADMQDSLIASASSLPWRSVPTACIESLVLGHTMTNPSSRPKCCNSDPDEATNAICDSWDLQPVKVHCGCDISAQTHWCCIGAEA